VTVALVPTAGFEVGTFGWNARDWIKQAGQADSKWGEMQFGQMRKAFEQVFATTPKLHASPGWRSNPHALRLTQRLGFTYASDTRGRHPFIPVWQGEIVRCPQIPVTLPTLDELITSPRQDPAALVGDVLALTANPPLPGHVFSLQVTKACRRNPQAIIQLLTGWREQGQEVTSIQTLASHLVVDKLPRHEIVVGKVPGRNDTVLLQGDEFLSAWRSPT
jgi:peptidoglycan/xylan/chitin deacetylase (PgdA/CDA1 family)